MKKILHTALTSSGKELLKHFGKTVEFKIKESQSSIVTKADLKSDSLIRNIIEKEYPTHNILSEESGFSDKHSNYTWVIDPLDGTSNFASALPWFGVLIALFENNIPIMGGAYLPVQDQLYFAEKGKGAFRNGIPIVMEKNTELINSLVAFSVDYTDDEMLFNKSISIYSNIVKASRNIRSTNSLVDFLYVAEGSFGGCINLFTRVWDISALGLIISEAGGMMRYIDGGEIKFAIDDKIEKENFPVMAGSEKIISKFKQTILL